MFYLRSIFFLGIFLKPNTEDEFFQNEVFFWDNTDVYFS